MPDGPDPHLTPDEARARDVIGHATGVLMYRSGTAGPAEAEQYLRDTSARLGVRVRDLAALVVDSAARSAQCRDP